MNKANNIAQSIYSCLCWDLLNWILSSKFSSVVMLDPICKMMAPLQSPPASSPWSHPLPPCVSDSLPSGLSYFKHLDPLSMDSPVNHLLGKSVSFEGDGDASADSPGAPVISNRSSIVFWRGECKIMHIDKDMIGKVVCFGCIGGSSGSQWIQSPQIKECVGQNLTLRNLSLMATGILLLEEMLAMDTNPQVYMLYYHHHEPSI